MLFNQWYIIARASEVPKNKPLPMRRLGEEWVAWRNAEGRVVCMKDRCPHRRTKLSKGKVCGGTIRCAYHGLRFDDTGMCRQIPSESSGSAIPKALKAETYPVEEAHGFIWLWWGEARETLPPLPWFSEFTGCLSHVSPPIVWPTHYTRIVENLLDAPHIPVVHGESFGKYFSDVVDPQGGVVWEDGRMKLLTQLRLKKGSQSRYLRMLGAEEDGSPARKGRPEDIAEAMAANPFDVQFMFPGYWRVGYRFRMFGRDYQDQFYSAVFITPVDENNTLFYIACYQKLVTLPIAGPLVCWISNLYDRKIGLQEDKDTVLSQPPRRAENEYYLQADLPIAEFHRHHKQLLEASGTFQAAEPAR